MQEQLKSPDRGAAKAGDEAFKVTTTRSHVTVSDGKLTKTFRHYKRGYFTFGSIETGAYIAANEPRLGAMGMSRSALNVMIGVSRNEGNLDAVNTWDSAFLTFGLFQWTLGTGDGPGELPALLRKIKQADLGVFARLYGASGLDVAEETGATHGRLMLDGERIVTEAEKAQFRRPEWGFRFWRAGQDPLVQSVSVSHAFSRIATFARAPRYRIEGHDLADIVTSEYGMALVLDNHVNRPAYVRACLELAIAEAGLSGTDPARWGTADERRLIERYLTIRQTWGTSPMTDAAGRAEVTREFLADGVISDERGSFRH